MYRLVGQADGEDRAAAERTLDGDFSTHRSTQALADRQAEASAAVLAHRRTVGLSELLKQFPELRLSYADAGVGHLKDQPIAPPDRYALDDQSDFTALGEFAGITQQVEEHLTHPRCVRVHYA